MSFLKKHMAEDELIQALSQLVLEARQRGFRTVSLNMVNQLPAARQALTDAQLPSLTKNSFQEGPLSLKFEIRMARNFRRKKLPPDSGLYSEDWCVFFKNEPEDPTDAHNPRGPAPPREILILPDPRGVRRAQKALKTSLEKAVPPPNSQPWEGGHQLDALVAQVWRPQMDLEDLALTDALAGFRATLGHPHLTILCQLLIHFFRSFSSEFELIRVERQDPCPKHKRLGYQVGRTGVES